MTTDISSILTENSLLGLQLGWDFNQVLDKLDELDLMYFFKKEQGNNAVFVIENLKLYFTNNELDFVIIRIGEVEEILFFNHIINKQISLQSLEEIIKMNNFSYFEREVTANGQMNLQIENKITFIFYIFQEQYVLNNIQWGGRVLWY